MGCIGDDFYGQCMSQKAAEDGVRALYRIDPKLPTGHCCVLVTDGGKCRSLVANLSAANAFEKSFLLDNWSAVESARIVYGTGFHLTVCPQAVVELAEHVHTSETPKLFAFNLSAPFIMQFFSSQLEQVMPYVDILFCNDSEAREFAKLKNWPESETIQQVITRIADLPRRSANRSRIVVITQDCEPVLMARSSEPKEADGADNPDNWTVIATPIEKLSPQEIVDTNGAGDAFAGGFVAQLAANQLALDLESLKRCVTVGSFCAREIIKQDGCTIPKKAFKL
jgi:adenosine kinase